MSDSLTWRRAVAFTFLVNGVIVGTWAPFIPVVKERLAIGEGALGVAFLAGAAGAVAAMVTVPVWSVRVGANRVTAIGAGALLVALPLLVAAPTYALLVATLVFFGASVGVMDVAMNAVAADVEKRAKKLAMSFFHAMFSVGAVIGTALGAASLGFDSGTVEWPAAPPVPYVAAVAMACAIALLRPLAALPRRVEAPDAEPPPAFVWPHGRLVAIALLAFAALISEGAVFDWGSILLREEFGATALVGGLAFAFFHVSMVVTRITGDRLRQRLGEARLLAAGGILAAAGLAATLLAGNPAVGLGGIALMGLGLGNAVPVLFAQGAAHGRTPDHGVAAVATLGYFGFLVGPPLIGGIAEVASLPASLWVIVGLCVAVAAGSRAVRPTASTRA